ncbi:hypothetical protein B4U79_16189 [Dinothrombium tinctorium]|uniref:Uncharacterized protein n=1 Tax=Dinothrombium tinctorium TaxID=1965070 RepID=A0A3S3PR94_9ACAR|nr:hypothetical protein B4U79_16189 [Dinothrombium tinctorium]
MEYFQINYIHISILLQKFIASKLRNLLERRYELETQEKKPENEFYREYNKNIAKFIENKIPHLKKNRGKDIRPFLKSGDLKEADLQLLCKIITQIKFDFSKCDNQEEIARKTENENHTIKIILDLRNLINHDASKDVQINLERLKGDIEKIIEFLVDLVPEESIQYRSDRENTDEEIKERKRSKMYLEISEFLKSQATSTEDILKIPAILINGEKILRENSDEGVLRRESVFVSQVNEDEIFVVNYIRNNIEPFISLNIPHVKKEETEEKMTFDDIQKKNRLEFFYALAILNACIYSKHKKHIADDMEWRTNVNEFKKNAIEKAELAVKYNIQPKYISAFEIIKRITGISQNFLMRTQNYNFKQNWWFETEIKWVRNEKWKSVGDPSGAVFEMFSKNKVNFALKELENRISQTNISNVLLCLEIAKTDVNLMRKYLKIVSRFKHLPKFGLKKEIYYVCLKASIWLLNTLADYEKCESINCEISNLKDSAIGDAEFVLIMKNCDWFADPTIGFSSIEWFTRMCLIYSEYYFESAVNMCTEIFFSKKSRYVRSQFLYSLSLLYYKWWKRSKNTEKVKQLEAKAVEIGLCAVDLDTRKCHSDHYSHEIFKFYSLERAVKFLSHLIDDWALSETKKQQLYFKRSKCYFQLWKERLGTKRENKYRTKAYDDAKISLDLQRNKQIDSDDVIKIFETICIESNESKMYFDLFTEMSELNDFSYWEKEYFNMRLKIEFFQTKIMDKEDGAREISDHLEAEYMDKIEIEIQSATKCFDNTLVQHLFLKEYLELALKLKKYEKAIDFFSRVINEETNIYLKVSAYVCRSKCFYAIWVVSEQCENKNELLLNAIHDATNAIKLKRSQEIVEYFAELCLKLKEYKKTIQTFTELCDHESYLKTEFLYYRSKFYSYQCGNKQNCKNDGEKAIMNSLIAQALEDAKYAIVLHIKNDDYIYRYPKNRFCDLYSELVFKTEQFKEAVEFFSEFIDDQAIDVFSKRIMYFHRSKCYYELWKQSKAKERANTYFEKAMKDAVFASKLENDDEILSCELLEHFVELCVKANDIKSAIVEFDDLILSALIASRKAENLYFRSKFYIKWFENNLYYEKQGKNELKSDFEAKAMNDAESSLKLYFSNENFTFKCVTNRYFDHYLNLIFKVKAFKRAIKFYSQLIKVQEIDAYSKTIAYINRSMCFYKLWEQHIEEEDERNLALEYNKKAINDALIATEICQKYQICENFNDYLMNISSLK